MSLSEVFSTIPTEEHFQNIRWKLVQRRDGHLCGNFQFQYCYERGRLHFADHKTHGLYYFVNKNGYWPTHRGSPNLGLEHLPVLVSGIRGLGWQDVLGNDKSVAGHADMCYFLTKKEYEYLSTEHKPIKIGSTIELQEPELIPL